ncbi:MAG: hypothetical protein ACRYGG_11850 [Janthinobacterium lividum]
MISPSTQTTLSTSIRLSVEDVALLKAIAARKGLKYQTYLKSVVRQEILKEMKHLGSEANGV